MGKLHLYELPVFEMPLEYPRDSKRLAISIPMFSSVKSNLSSLFGSDDMFSLDRFDDLVVRSGAWSALSILTNTDLGEHGVPLYFHVEDVVYDRVVSILSEYGIPETWIRQTTFPKFPHEEVYVSHQTGKKLAVFADDGIDADVCMMVDSDAFVYRHPGDKKFQWYQHYADGGVLSENPLFSFYSEWNGGVISFVNWLRRATGLLQIEFDQSENGWDYGLSDYEAEAYARVGFDKPDTQFRWGGFFFSCPRHVSLFDFLAKHHTIAYTDEGLMSLYMNVHSDMEYHLLEDLFCPRYLEDRDMLKLSYSAVVHPRGVDRNAVARYRPRLLSGLDGRNESLSSSEITHKLSFDVNDRLACPEIVDRIVPEFSKGTLHIISVPHNPSHKDFSTCAFAQKARKNSYMGVIRGYNTIHYGNELSDVYATEHVSVTTEQDLKESYGDFRDQRGFYDWAPWHYAYKMFNMRAEHELRKRFQPGDIICYTFGPGARYLYDRLQNLKDALHCESGIGYFEVFAPYRVYESPGIMHFMQGLAQGRYNEWDKIPKEGRRRRDMQREVHYSEMRWYDAVIPNSFDLEDFEYSETHDDYFLALGRIHPGKGLEIAMRVAHGMGKKLVVAGQGDWEKQMKFKPWPNVEIVGRADVEERKRLLANCKALLCLSTYPEPFGGVHIEANLSGKPVISTDTGAFCHTVKNKLTGFRCRWNILEQARYAAERVDEIDPKMCRRWGQLFRTERVAHAYDEYFQSIIAAHANNGRPHWIDTGKCNYLDWLDDTFDWIHDPIIEPVCVKSQALAITEEKGGENNAKIVV